MLGLGFLLDPHLLLSRLGFLVVVGAAYAATIVVIVRSVFNISC